MVLRIEMTKVGGPEVLAASSVDLPSPNGTEVRVRNVAVGVNFIDIYHRTGLYPLPALPAVLGVEGAGVVEALGSDAEGVAVGDHVAYCGLPVGSYAEARNIPASRLIKVPPAISLETASAAMLRGITAHLLLTRVARIKRGSTILIHAAAGGLGQIVTQWARTLGAHVIGTVGSEAKAEIARRLGVNHVILHKTQDFVADTRKATDGRGVDLAIDGVGGETFLRTLDCVAPFGIMASIGQAGGHIPQISVNELGPRRSIALARPSVVAHTMDIARYRESAAALMDAIGRGLSIGIGLELPLRDAATAHRAMESGKTTGSVLLKP